MEALGRSAVGLREGQSGPSLFERIYLRAGPHTWAALLGAVVGFVLVVVVPAYCLLLFPFFRASGNQYGEIVLVFEIAMGVAGAAAFVIGLRSQADLIEWMRGVRGPDRAVAAWNSAVIGLPRTAGLVGAVYAICCVPPGIYTALEIVHLSWWGGVIYLFILLLLVLGMVVFGYLFFEQALRPVVREISRELPTGFNPQTGALSLGVKVLALLPAINLSTGTVVAMVSTNSLGLEAGLAVGLGSAVLVGLTLSLGFTLIFRRSLMDRLTELRNAMRRVDQGEYEIRVAPIAGDEIDDLGQSFNQMVEGLRERESLREHNVELVDELRASRTRIVATADAERRRMERDLHDGAQQHLVLLKMKLGLLEERLARDADTRAGFQELASDLGDALADLRDLAHGIYPAILEHEGLPAALQAAVGRAPIPAKVESNGTGRYRPELEAAVYFCCLEALQNAAKHAGEGAEVTVRLSERDGALDFEVSDNGAGFDPSLHNGSAGLQNMADRIGALGGRLEVESAPGKGTRVKGAVPVEG